MAASYVHFQRVFTNGRVSALVAFERPYVRVSRARMVGKLSQRHKATVAFRAEKRKIVHVHLVHMLLQQRVVFESVPTQITGRFVA